MGGHEKAFIVDAVDNGWVTPLGPNVDGFESDLSAFMDTNIKVTALSSGTAALHLALIIAGVQVGDEVICQSMTFAASANPCRYLGATPVFIDSEKLTWNMDVNLLEEAIKDRIKLTGKVPKAIIPVHLYGMPAQMVDILEVAARYNIPVIEDAAEALGSSIDGKQCGTFGTMSILSFNGNKIITTSSGGALVSYNEDYTNKAKFLGSQAKDPAPHYEHTEIGYNYRMSNLCAGAGRGQMIVLADRIEKRRSNYNFYEQHLQLEGVSFLSEQEGVKSNRWLTTIIIDPVQTGGITRQDIAAKLQQNNIESRPLWKPMHMQPIYQTSPFYGNGTSEQLFADGLCLPSGSDLTDTDLKRVVSTIREAIPVLNV